MARTQNPHTAKYAATRKRYRDANPNLFRECNLRRLYGITLTEYNEMFAAQQGKCKICATHQSEFKKRILNVDHNHTTGQVRGLLCTRCNIHVAFLEDEKRSQKAKEYLDSYLPKIKAVK